MFMGPSFWWGPSPFNFFYWNSYQVNFKPQAHPGGNPGANLQSISDRCYLRKVAFA